MTRGRMLALGAVLLAVVAALALRVAAGPAHPAAATVGPSPTPVASAADLAGLRRAAALDPCPTGLGAALPDLTLPCLGGGPEVRLASPGTGVPTLVNVYGSWCAPCQDEMPRLVAFARQAGPRVRMVGVDTEDEPSQALAFARDFGQHWSAVVDDDKAVLRHYASGPPVTLFLDASGRLVFVQRGPFHTLAELEAAVAQHLGVRV